MYWADTLKREIAVANIDGSDVNILVHRNIMQVGKCYICNRNPEWSIYMVVYSIPPSVPPSSPQALKDLLDHDVFF